MFNPKKRIKLENKHMSTFFFMWFIIFFFMTVWQMVKTKQANTIVVMMVFICLVISMSFKNWQLIREVDDKIDYEIIKRRL